MAEFQYRATDSSGAILKSAITAADRRSAMAKLAARGLRVIDLKGAEPASASQAAISSEDSKRALSGGEKLALMFFKKVLQLCKGGMPLGDALKSLAQRSLNKDMQALSRELYKSVSEGATVASAMQNYPKIFEPCIVHLSEAGESTANIVAVFTNIVEYLESKRQLRASVSSALVYPIILCSLAFGVVLLFLFYLMPMIENMMANLGGELNLPVKILLFMGDAMIYGTPIVAAVVFISIIAIAKWRQSESGRIESDKILLKSPLIGKIVFNADICRFTNLISTLYQSGVNTTETFRLAEKTIKNAYLRLQFQQCRLAVNDGVAVAQAFKNFKILDDDDIDILSVGERTGSLVECFAEIKKMHDEILRSDIKTATSILTAVALLSAVVIIFLVALGIVSSVFGLSENLV